MSLEIKENLPLAGFTIYKIGGPARFFVEAKSASETKEAVLWAQDKGLNFFVLGAGSNMLVADKGFNGLAIHIAGGEVKTEGENLTADAGVMMARSVLESAKAGLAGFEWGIGIPGTIGGSVRGNAGCFGGEMSQVLEKVQVLGVKTTAQNPKLPELTNAECEFGYRDSIFKKHPEWIILSATLKLRKGDKPEIQEKIKKISAERSQKQDIGTKSCGCIFKNVPWHRKDINPVRSQTPEASADPTLSDRTSNGVNKEKLLKRFPDLKQFENRPNIPASYLIDAAGLKGKRIGRALVSPKHANYFINEGGATAEEVVMLIASVKDAVKKKFGILLEEEIQYIGF